MATFKAVVRTPRKDGFYQVYIRVMQNRKPGYIRTDKVVNKEGLGKDGSITDPFVTEYCARRILRFTELLNRVDCSMWTVRQVIEYVTMGDEDLCFSNYARLHINRMIDNGQIRNAQNYRLALQHLERFAGTTRVMFAQLTSTFVNRWIRTLDQTHRAKEMYPICMRQVFRAAVKEYNDYDTGLLRIKMNPWSKVQIPSSDRTTKIAISPEECRLFFSAPLPDTKMKDPLPELARDVAKMVLCLAGINTVDLFEMQKENYRNGILCYNRAKTKKTRNDDAYIEMRVEPVIQPIVDKYLSDADDPYLFKFHKRFCNYDSFCVNVNNGIKQVCESMKIPKAKQYKVYTFRHTWGTVAQNDCGASIDQVAFAMNHTSGRTITRGYIKLDFSPAWELNAKVIDFIFFSTAQSKQGLAQDVDHRDNMFRIAAKYMVYARAYFRGEVLAEVSDIGFNNIEEVIARLVPQLPSTIPPRCAVQFRIKNVDTGREAVYERTKGKGF